MFNESSKSVEKRGFSHILLVTLVLGSIFVIGVFALSYNSFGNGGLPIGWDTPRYVGQMVTISSGGIISFIQTNGYYNFMYAAITSLFVSVGVSPFVVEIVFPIFLCIGLMSASGYFAKKYLGNTEIAVLTILLAATWFGLYRVGTDLHPNLLAIVLLIVALTIFPPWISGNSSSRFRRYLFFPIILLASFIHIEITLFFSFIIVLVSILNERKLSNGSALLGISKTVFPLSLAILPSLILYYFHMTTLVKFSNGNPVFQPPLAANLWLTYLGFLLPFSVYGFYRLLRAAPNGDSGERSSLAFSYRAFIGIWAIASIALACMSYAIPVSTIFSERALMLFPAPFLAALAVKLVIDRTRRGIQFHFSKRSRRIISLSIICLIFFSGWVCTYTTVTVHQKVWVSQSVYEKLVWLSNNHVSEKPIFVYYDYDEYAGSLGNLYSDWVQAIYGDHYSYVGRIDFLLAKQETPFKSPVSKTFSGLYLDRILKDGLFANNTLFNHEVIIIDDFYKDGDFQKQQRIGILTEIHEGTYVVNTKEAAKRQNVALYSSVYAQSGNWYAIERNWTESLRALEFWNPTPTENASFEMLLPSAGEGQFTLSLGYRDGLASDMIVELNGTSIGTIHYRQTGESSIFRTNVSLSEGIYALKVSIPYESDRYQYACLDFVELSQLKSEADSSKIKSCVVPANPSSTIPNV